MQKFLWQTLAALFLTLSLVYSYWTMPDFFKTLDSRMQDMLFMYRGAIPTSDKVVIVDIDEKSLKKYGQWPWPRDIFAQLIANLTNAGAGIIGLDIVFSEEDGKSPDKFAKLFGYDPKDVVNNDEILASVFAQAPVIGGYTFLFDGNYTGRDPTIPAIFIEENYDPMLSTEQKIYEGKSIVLNIPVIQKSLYSSGFFNNVPDDDNIIRSVPLVMKYDMSIYPSLAFEMLRAYKNESQVIVHYNENGIEYIKMGDLVLPTDESGRFSVNFRGPGHTFKYISAADIIDNTFDPKDIDGKFVLVGTSALGLLDLRGIVYDSAFPGVEVHANLIDNVLEKDFIVKNNETTVIDLFIIIGVTILSSALFALLRASLTIPTLIGVLVALFCFYYYMLFTKGMILNILFPVLGLFLSFIFAVVIEYLFEGRKKELVMKAFAKKVSPAVMEELTKNPDVELLEAKDKEISISFSDIRSFTTISEHLGSPHKVIEMLNLYMTPMVQNIVEHEGTVDKFIGDAIMAYWNAPTDVENHADHALQSSIEQVNMLPEVNKKLKEKFDGLEINFGIGINTGVATVGDMGSEGRSDYTIIGDSVNLASRVEGLNKPYAAQIVITEFTKAQLTQEYPMRRLDFVQVKGKSEPVEIFEVFSDLRYEKYQVFESEFNRAVDFYRDAKLEEAYPIFKELYNKYSDKVCSIFVDRCEHFMNNPDVEFTLVEIKTTK